MREGLCEVCGDGAREGVSENGRRGGMRGKWKGGERCLR